ncbi:MAG: TrkH family potassium uptake protein [Oscillospiraceae bacterium]|nr:TrkH family potassium uptake protein [Oscillospiraceae bacterium]
MNKQAVAHYLCRITAWGSLLFLIPAIVSLVYGEWDSLKVFIEVAMGMAVLSLPMAILKPKESDMFAKEGLMIVALLWVIYPVAGALPFWLSGEIPSFVDAVFESVSGFTTTGSTILTDIESMSHGMLFWRSFTHWVGGMGVLVLAIAILPANKATMHLMRAECAGPQVGKLTPKGRTSARYLYIIYGVLTVVLTGLLILGGMPVFDSICHAMGTAGTGGFGIKNNGIAFYNSRYIEYVLTVGMIVFGVNFSIYYLVLTGHIKTVLRNAELRVYLIIILIATGLIMGANIMIHPDPEENFRTAVFQVSSIMTSTGFGTDDYALWPEFSQMILLILMFIGACAGSTGGGLKVQRIIIMFKSVKKFVRQTLSPKCVYVLKGEDKTMDTATVHGVQTYFILYTGLMFISLLLVSADNHDFATSFSSVVTCINNIGPGLNKVGPTQNFSFFSDFAKIILSFDMLLGRLECLPVIVMLSPSVWRNKF